MTTKRIRQALAVGVGLLLASCATTPERAMFESGLEQRLAGHIQYLASDELEGRFPGTEGGRMAVAYQVEKLKEYGFEPGYLGQFRQPVTLSKNIVADVVLNVGEGDDARQVQGADVYLLGTSPRLVVGGAMLVAVAPGIDDMPESVAGKVLLLDNPAPRSDQLAQAVESEAAALIIVVDDEVRMGRAGAAASRARYGLASDANDGMPLLYISGDTAKRVIDRPDLSLEDSFARASEQDGFYQLPFAVGIEARIEKEEIFTHNVIGVLPGTKPDSGAVMLLAHWDHLGRCGPEDAEDRICNGASDNASGIAAMLEAARAVARGPRPERDVYIMGNTAEELGLLGARAFAENPPIPADRFVATFSMDTLAITPAKAPLTIVGVGTTPLDYGIKEVGARLGRTFDIKDEHQQFARRHDGWALMQAGIPSVVVGGGFGDQEAMNTFFASRYHKAADEFDEGFQMGGMLADMPLYVELLRYFGSTESYMPPSEE